MIFMPQNPTRILMGVLGAFVLLSVMPVHGAKDSGVPSETELMEKQRVMEKDLEFQVQSLLNKIMGPDQSEVKASVSLSLLKQVLRKEGSGERTRRKDETPLGETKYLLPGVPAQKTVSQDRDPDNTDRQRAEQAKAQQQVTFKIKVRNRQVTVFYNEILKAKEPEARRSIQAMTKLKDSELKFIPGKFFSNVNTFWKDLARDPKNILISILLFLLFLLLLWLFVPLMGFFRNYITAMKEKGGIEVKMESESEGQQEGMGGENGAGLTPAEIEAQKLAGGGGDDEMGKKYAPFEYINEENIKRLLGVFRKEPPQVIALILSYLKPELVRLIYSELPPDIQTKVAAESGALRQATEEQVRIVDENIKAKIDFLVGGVDNLIRILDEVDYKIRDNILEYLMNHRPQLYEKVRSSLLLFEDILKFPDLAIQPIIRELRTEQLARSLKTASPDMLNKFMTNMSQGGAALLKEEMEYGRAVTEEQIEQERQIIINVIKRLEDEGKIHVRDKKKISVFDSEDATSPLTPNLPDDDFSPTPVSAPSQAGPGADAESYLSAGSQLYQEQNYSDALPYLQYVTQLDPGHIQAWQMIGHCYYGLGMMPEALQHYEHALSLNPNNQELRQWVEQFKQSVAT